MAIDYEELTHYICLFLSEIGRNPDWVGHQEWRQVAKAIARVVGDGIDDHKVISSDTDTTTPGGLLQKLLAGTGISLQETLDGAVNKVRITNTAPDDHLVFAIANDPTGAGPLLQKLSEGLGITLTQVNEGGVNKVRVTSTNSHTHTAGTGIDITNISSTTLPNYRITNTLPETYKVDVTGQDFPGYLDQKIVVGPGLNKRIVQYNSTPFEQLYITLDPQATDPTSGGVLYTAVKDSPGTPTTVTLPTVTPQPDIVSGWSYFEFSEFITYWGLVDAAIMPSDPNKILTQIRVHLTTHFVSSFGGRILIECYDDRNGIPHFFSAIDVSPSGMAEGSDLIITGLRVPCNSNRLKLRFEISPASVHTPLTSLTQGNLTFYASYEDRTPRNFIPFNRYPDANVAGATYPLNLPIIPGTGRRLKQIRMFTCKPFVSDTRPTAKYSFQIEDYLGNVLIPWVNTTDNLPYIEFSSGAIDVDYGVLPLNIRMLANEGTLAEATDGQFWLESTVEETTTPSPTVISENLLTGAQIVSEPASLTEYSATATLSSPGEVSMGHTFPSLLGTPGVTQIPAGTFTFRVYGHVNGTTSGVTNAWRAKLAVWRFGQPSPDAPFITATSANIFATLPTVTTFTGNLASPITVTANDIFYLEIFAVTDGAVSRTFTLIYNDVSRSTSVTTTVPLMGGTGTIDHWSTTNRDRLESHPASAISTVVTNFNKNLSSADDTVQKALDTLDNITIHGGSGTSNYLAKWANSTTLGDSHIIDVSGAAGGALIQGETNGVSVRLYTTNATAGNRNWVIANGHDSFGDFVIRQSNLITGDPYGITGRTALRFDDVTLAAWLASSISISFVEFRGSSSGAVTVQSPAAPTSWTLTLPTTAGTNNYILKTDGAGVSSWVSLSSLGGVLTTRTINTTNGLQGGGDLSADRTLSPVYGTAVNTVCQGNDSRLSDDRTASGIRTLTTVVSVAGATAPSSGQVLRAASSTAATWQTLTPADIGALPAANINVTQNYLAKGGASAGTLTNSIIRDDGTRASIGSAPGSALFSISTTGTADNLRLDSSGTGMAGIQFAMDTAIKGYFAQARYAGNFFSDAAAGDMVFRSEADSIRFGSGTAESTLVVTSLKNVGVGTGAPQRKLEVVLGASSSVSPLTNMSDLGGAYLGIHPGNAFGGFNTSHGIMARSDVTGGIALGGMVWRRFGVSWESALDFYSHPSGTASVDQVSRVASLTPTEATFSASVSGTDVKLRGGTSGTVTLQSPAAPTSWTLTLPTTSGSPNQFLQTDGAGNTTWASGGTGTVTGSGTAGRLPRWVTTTSLGDSGITDDGTTNTTVVSSRNFYVASGQLSSGTNGTAGGTLQLKGSTSGTVTVQTAAAPTSWSFTLPTSAGTDGFVLKTNGSGVSSWVSLSSLGATSGSGTPGNLAMWNGASTVLGDAGVTDSGTVITVLSSRSLYVPSGTIQSGVNGVAGGTVQLRGSTSGTVTVRTAAAAGTWTLQLPATAGSSGQVLRTDGTGITTWIGVVTGSGNTNFIPRWTSSTALGDSGMSDNGSTVFSARTLAVTGASTATQYLASGTYTQVGTYLTVGSYASITGTVTAANFNTTTSENCWAGYYSSANASYTTVGGTHNVVMGNGISCGTSTSYNILLGENSSAGNSSNHCIGLEGQFGASVSTSVAIHTTSSVDSSYMMKIGYKNQIVINNSSNSNWIYMATPMSTHTGAALSGIMTSWLPIACKPDSVNFGGLCLGNFSSGLYSVYFQPWY